MKALILYFSGTGNTDYVAKDLHAKLKDLSISTEVRSIETIFPGEVAEFDLLILGFPIYAGAAPEFFRQYLKNLPSAKEKGVFVFCTRAMYEGQAINHVYKQLETKGYIPLGHTSMEMPGSDGLPFMSKDSKYVRRALDKNYGNIREINEFAQRIACVIGEINKVKSLKGLSMKAPRGIPGFNKLLQLLWDAGYSFAEKKMKPKFRAEKEKCVQCGVCIKQCPAKNISMTRDSISFAAHCYMCMRCINQCPCEAIQIGKGTVNKFRWKGPTGDFKPPSSQAVIRTGKNKLSKPLSL